ncbi:hypothetical protein MNBD_GAMMA02-866 [hydrothermal vent metagenome]|uniref:Uncharacterized protein n=1 Tax=hydrothermal vent metagenome TaxID=652676 RepID=A0A3B0WB16_9ZZZZ
MPNKPMHFVTITGMKKIIILFGLLCHILFAAAQTDIEPNPTAYPESDLAIGSATEMANHLRTEYGIAKSVYLTQIAQQLSQSFASTEQLQQQWQQALATEIIEPNHFTQINTHALMAQTLIQYTNGMSLNRWRLVDLPLTPEFRALNDPYVSSRTFQTWLNLNYHWQQILANGGKNNMAQWLNWFTMEAAQNSDQTAVNNSLNLLLAEWNKTAIGDLDQLTAMAEKIGYFDPLATALMRQQLHLINEQSLALAYDWIEIYQLLELSGDLLTAKEQQQLSKLVVKASTYWANSEDEVNTINEPLFGLINELLTTLPEKFKNPDHFNIQLNQQILTLITGIKKPNTYFVHPLREEIQENLEVCLNLSVQQNPEPPVPIALNQFESCLTDFIEWGTTLASSGNLSGNLIKLDNPSSINRALDLPSVQIINNLSMQAAAEISCQQQLVPQVNLLEWLLAAETVAWFHDRWPGLMAAHLKDQQIEQLIDAGTQLYQYPACMTDADPLLSQFNGLKDKWERLKQEIVIHVSQYQNAELSPNSDVNLFKSIDQQTNYIAENFMVSPCDATLSCGALVTLEPSNELLNLFPNHLKLAEQFGLGQLEICYDQVQWEHRKTTPTHLDNNKIANFEGQLSIQLNGRFRGESVFTKSLLSEQRHIYLFGENNQETLDTSCPLPIIGKQINTSLDRGTFGLLPNRLTFLAAQKVDINAVMRSNWSQWQTQLNAQPNEFSYFNEMNEVKTALNDAFLQKVNELQQQIYRKLITNNQSKTTDSALSKAAFEYTTHRKLLSHMTMGLYPQLYSSRSTLQAAISGNNRLVDMTFFREAFENQTNVADMIDNGDANFNLHQETWGAVDQVESLIHNTLDQLQQILNFVIPENTHPEAQ